MSDAPRVAFLADSFHEVNGAARACRELEAYAKRKGYPFFSARFGPEPHFGQDGSVTTLQLKRSWMAFPVDPDLKFDPRFYWNRPVVAARLREVRPDLVHITSPGDMGILGAIAAAVLKVPLVLSWHTNLHEFAARRTRRLLGWLPGAVRRPVENRVDRFVLDRVLWFYGRGQALLAPSLDLREMLERETGKPAFFMGRGVDTVSFSPDHRRRDDETLTIGYVGRLMPEKNVRFLAEVEKALVRAGITGFRIVMAGDGMERAWLGANIQRGVLTGVLHGADLSRAYADFDIFAFPSRTDTFGQVVQEAQSSGVPAVVTDRGGPRFVVDHGETGFVTGSDEEFLGAMVRLARDAALRRRMGAAARRMCLERSWDKVFEEVYRAYEYCRSSRQTITAAA